MNQPNTSDRLGALFGSGRKNLLAMYFMAGYPRRDDTAEIAQALDKAGVDLIEIGIPFSDPIADGPVIQIASQRALENGMTVERLISQLTDVRRATQKPIVLMGYLNPVIQYGFEKFCLDAAAAGADALLLPDLPLNEFARYEPAYVQSGLRPIFLVAPTTSDERIQLIDGLSKGFVYAVSTSGTTGVRNDFGEEQLAYFQRLEKLGLKNPVLVGFGISGKTTFEKACRHTSGGIVGSALVSLLAQPDWKAALPGFVAGFRT